MPACASLLPPRASVYCQRLQPSLYALRCQRLPSIAAVPLALYGGICVLSKTRQTGQTKANDASRRKRRFCVADALRVNCTRAAWRVAFVADPALYTHLYRVAAGTPRHVG